MLGGVPRAVSVLLGAGLLAVGTSGQEPQAARPSRDVREEALWVVYEGGSGPGSGKHVVLVSGDEEYRSEEALPALGRILAVRHGFRCTVLFAIDPRTGEIDPDVRDNIPGLQALDDADVMVIATRFRNLPDHQMRHVVAYLEAGKPVVGMRTATHAFRIPQGRRYARYDFRSKEWPGGFGRQVLGETWIRHHGRHGREGTRGILVPEMRGHPILRGLEDGAVFGPTDVYAVRLPLPERYTPLVLGQVTAGLEPDAPPVEGPRNDPMMPVAWCGTYEVVRGRRGRVFTTTMGAATDLVATGTRRLLVNAVYWAAGLEDRIPAEADVEFVGEFRPRPFGFHGFERGVRPSRHALPR